MEPLSHERIKKSNSLKLQGSDAFKKKDLELTLKFYKVRIFKNWEMEIFEFRTFFWNFSAFCKIESSQSRRLVKFITYLFENSFEKISKTITFDTKLGSAFLSIFQQTGFRPRPFALLKNCLKSFFYKRAITIFCQLCKKAKNVFVVQICNFKF